jgi:hypothetical protein
MITGLLLRKKGKHQTLRAFVLVSAVLIFIGVLMLVQ